MDADVTKSITLSNIRQLWEPGTRREFLRVAALGGSAVLLPAMFAACGDDDGGPMEPPPPDAVVLDLSSDAGVLNYAYALEQLEAAFYTQVIQAFYAGITPEEQQVLTDIGGHEVIHRDFLAATLGGARIPDLMVDFAGGNVDFTSRFSVLSTAKIFEDGGVAAYNGAGRLLTDLNNLLVAGKIVSVEARHAAAIRDLLRPGTRDFAGDDVVDPSGLDQAFEPGFVLQDSGLGQFIITPIEIVS
ncbi:MAG: ferritin-like domain-containing protein [Gemmatimonadales bacterium]|nr:ferritin-like domain-containing protein [Gemmatimonadales bacterium]